MTLKSQLLLSKYNFLLYLSIALAGAVTHSLDYRHSGGCCIQGFRYTGKNMNLLSKCVHEMKIINYCGKVLFLNAVK